MSYLRKSLGRVAVVVCVCLTTALIGVTAKGQLPELYVRVGDTTALPGAQNTVISIYMSNFHDTVSGFNLYIQLDRPDIMEFKTDTATVVDTTYWKCLGWDGPICVDSILSNPLNADTFYIDTHLVYVGNFDTVGTISSGWAMMDARSISGSGYDVNVAGLAFTQNDTDLVGIAPQQDGLLVKILADVYDIPDTMTDRTVNMVIIHDVLDHYNFSRPDGSSIGIVYDMVPDTNCWICTAWVIPGEVCANWERVSIPPPGGCDSIDVDMDSVPRVDTMTVTLLDGSLTVLGYVCGDADGSGGSPNVADVTYLVAYLFLGGPAPSPLQSGNVDCQGPSPDVADLTYMVAYLFLGGPPPCDGC